MIKHKEALLKLMNLDSQTVDFFSHSKNYLQSNLFVKSLSLISMPIFTHLLLPSAYGILAVFQTVVSLLVLIMSGATSGGIYRRFFEKEKDYSEFLGSNLLFLIPFCVIISLLILFFIEPLSVFFNLPSSVLVFCPIAAFFGVIFSIYTRLLQAQNFSKKYSKLVILQAFLQFILSLALMLMYVQDKRYIASIFGALITQGIFFLFGFWMLLKIAKFKFNFNHIKYTLSYGLPMLPNSFGGYLLSYFDKILVAQLASITSAGIYSVGFNIGMLLVVVTSSITSAWSPKFFAYMEEKRYSDLQSLAVKSTKIILVFAFGIIISARVFIYLFTPVSYHESYVVVIPVVIGYVFFFFYNIYSFYSEFRKKTIFFSINTIISSFLGVLLNYIFIPRFGYIASAFISMISFASMFVLHYFTVRFILKEHAVKVRGLVFLFIMFVVAVVLHILLIVLFGGLYSGLINILVVAFFDCFIFALFCAFLFKGVFSKFIKNV
jgi:O-antigen/teichoic acid export membrane protein